jgi:hypothetical protein
VATNAMHAAMLALALGIGACVRAAEPPRFAGCAQTGRSAIARRLATASVPGNPSDLGGLVVRAEFAQDSIVLPLVDARMVLMAIPRVSGGVHTAPKPADASGQARFDSLPSGVYLLTVRAIGHAARRDTVHVRDSFTDTAVVSLRTDAIRDFCLR